MLAQLEELTLNFIRPLCPKTEELFRPLGIKPTDRIKLALAKDNAHFKAELFSFGKQWGSEEIVKRPASYNAAVRFPQVIPERRNFSDTKWQFGASDITSLIIAYHWKNEQISYANDATRVRHNYNLANFVKQTRGIFKRELVDNFEFNDSPHYPLAHYQKKALKACLGAEGFGLFMEQGTGKTAVCIARIMNEAKKMPDGEFYKCLIICPKNVRTNWEAEFHKFATLPGKITVVRGDKLNRFKCIVDAMRKPRPGDDMKYSIVVMSYDSVDKTFEPLELIDWNLCILDESHYIKNRSTKRWKAMQKLRDKCAARMVLTGTPITNTLFDLFTQFEFMGEGWSGFNSWDAFKKFYGVFAKTAGQDQSGYNKLVGLDNVPLIQERLARQSYLIKKATALPDLPKKTYDIHEVEMSMDQESAYRKLCSDLMIELESDMAATDGNPAAQVLAVNNILTKMLRLAQITSGFMATSDVLGDDGEIVEHGIINRFDPNPKVEELVSILEKKSVDDKTIVWACFVQDIKTIAARLKIEGIDCVTYYGATTDDERTEAVRRFNCDPKCTVFIGNPAAGGTGINLLGYDHSLPYHWPAGPPTHCDQVIYYSQGWSHPYRSQSEDRPHRRGTAGHVQYTDLVVPGTIDEEIRERVVMKRRHAMKVQDIREILQRMKG